MKNDKYKGFTLPELIVSIIIMAMLSLIVGVIFHTVFMGGDIIDREASMQAEMRTSMQSVSRTVERSTAVFILDDSKYDGSKGKLTEKWSYVGLSEDGKRIINYVWNKKTEDWDIRELGTKSIYDMKLSLNFSADDNYKDSRVIKYELTGEHTEEKKKKKLKIDSSSMALNSKQAFSRIAKGKKGVALAYRTEEIEGQPLVSISFIFDISLSMEADMWGYLPEVYKRQSRIDILKDKAKIMMEELADVGNVHVNLIQFGDSGAYVQEEFINLENDLDASKKMIDRLQLAGATNPGDGLRHSLVSLAKQKTEFKYVVLLTDGLPNRVTYNGKKGWERKPDVSEIVGADASKDLDWPGYDASALYVGQVTEALGAKSGVKRVSFIGFSAKKDEIQMTETMEGHVNKAGIPAKKYDAGNEEELQQTFADIAKQIKQDLWFAEGP